MKLKAYFNSIDSKKIDEFITNKQGETLHLEFKQISREDFSNKDDKNNFACALSGFANSDGGIVVWGIKARKNKKGLDCADAKVPLNDVQLFLSKLNEFTGQFVSPPVEGVLHKSIKLKNNIGFVKTLIPASDIGPHMAKAGSSNFKYFKRSGDSFYPMEHYDIADMFGKRKKPKLSIFTKIVKGSSDNYEIQFNIVIGIRNDGRSIAKYPYLWLDVHDPFKVKPSGLSGSFSDNLPKLIQPDNKSSVRVFCGTSNHVIHTGSELQVTCVEIRWRKDAKTLDDLFFDYQLGCDGIDLIQDSYQISGENLLKQFKETCR